MHARSTTIFLAIPRTGTTHLLGLASAIREIDVRYELFNSERVASLRDYELAALSVRTGIDLQRQEQPELIKWVHRNPVELLDVLQTTVEARGALVFKLFPDQLVMANLQRLLERPNTTAIVLSRKPIDAYISLQKALGANVFSRLDTTAVQINLSAEHFHHWLQERRYWYSQLSALFEAQQVTYAELNYETDIQSSTPTELTSHIVETLTKLGVACTVPATLGASLPRQDLANSYADKVSNWQEFCHRLEALGMLRQAFEPFAI